MSDITRLLGRPQPQMYTPVVLSQYTWVNRTHNKEKIDNKFFICENINIFGYLGAGGRLQ